MQLMPSVLYSSDGQICYERFELLFKNYSVVFRRVWTILHLKTVNCSVNVADERLWSVSYMLFNIILIRKCASSDTISALENTS